MGGAFGYFYLIPYGLYFLAQFGLDVGLTQVIGFGDYITWPEGNIWFNNFNLDFALPDNKNCFRSLGYYRYIITYIYDYI